jgi:putative endonuclease
MITVYVLKGLKGKRYVGITNDPDRRLKEHRSGSTKGGQVIGDFNLLYTKECRDYDTARKLEKFLKSGQGREWLDQFELRMLPAASTIYALWQGYSITD